MVFCKIQTDGARLRSFSPDGHYITSESTEVIYKEVK